MNTRALSLGLGALLLLAGGLYLRFGGGQEAPVAPVLQALSGPALGPKAELASDQPAPDLDTPRVIVSKPKTSSRRSAPVIGSGLALEVRLMGKPATAAQVFGTPLGGPLQSLGSADVEGMLNLRLDPGSWTLCVKAPSAATSSRVVWLERGKETSLRLDLYSPETIEGLVRDTAGQPVRGSAVVWAWDSEEPDALSLLRKGRGRRMEPSLFQARTDARGFFRVNGLNPNRSYRLAAIGPSSISIQGQVIKAGQKADLRLSPVVVHLVQFLDPVKGSLPSPSLGGASLWPEVELAPGATRLDLASYPELWLTPIGKLLGRMPERAGPLGPLVVAAVPPTTATEGSSSAQVSLEFPGFLPLGFALDLASMGDLPPFTSVNLERAGGPAVGSLRLNLRLAAEIVEVLREDPRELGEVHLGHADGRVMSLRLPAMAGMPHTVSGIPPGIWELSFHSRDGELNLANSGRVRGKVTIKSGREVSTSLDLMDLAAVQLDLIMDAEGLLGGDWGGSVILTYGPEKGAGRFVSIPRAPYLMLGLAPGPFVFRVLRLRGNQARGESGPIEVIAGELAQGTLPLVPPKRR